MSRPSDSRPTELELQAFVDGELSAERHRVVAAAIAADPALARQTAELRDLQARFEALSQSLAAMPIPERLRQAAAAPPALATGLPQPRHSSAGRDDLRQTWGQAWHRMGRPGARQGLFMAGAVAAAVVLAVSLRPLLPPAHAPADQQQQGQGEQIQSEQAQGEQGQGGQNQQALLASAVVREALDARDGKASAIQRVALDDEAAGETDRLRDETNRLVAATLGGSTRAPDLKRLGFRLVSAELYPDRRLQLRYRDRNGTLFTVFVHPGPGPDRFALLSRQAVQICLWQNEDASVVMAASLPTSELFRLSSVVYASMSL